MWFRNLSLAVKFVLAEMSPRSATSGEVASSIYASVLVIPRRNTTLDI